jgi:chromosome segregation ATPase
MNDKKPYALLEREFEDLRKIYASLVGALEGINAELEHLRSENEFYKKQLFNADNRVEISKDIVNNNLEQSQKTHDNLVKEILKLKGEIKQLKG